MMLRSVYYAAIVGIVYHARVLLASDPLVARPVLWSDPGVSSYAPIPGISIFSGLSW